MIFYFKFAKKRKKSRNKAKKSRKRSHLDNSDELLSNSPFEKEKIYYPKINKSKAINKKDSPEKEKYENSERENNNNNNPVI